jgi:hypothetical protein
MVAEDAQNRNFTEHGCSFVEKDTGFFGETQMGDVPANQQDMGLIRNLLEYRPQDLF